MEVTGSGAVDAANSGSEKTGRPVFPFMALMGAGRPSFEASGSGRGDLWAYLAARYDPSRLPFGQLGDLADAMKEGGLLSGTEASLFAFRWGAFPGLSDGTFASSPAYILSGGLGGVGSGWGFGDAYLRGFLDLPGLYEKQAAFLKSIGNDEAADDVLKKAKEATGRIVPQIKRLYAERMFLDAMAHDPDDRRSRGAGRSGQGVGFFDYMPYAGLGFGSFGFGGLAGMMTSPGLSFAALDALSREADAMTGGNEGA